MLHLITSHNNFLHVCCFLSTKATEASGWDQVYHNQMDTIIEDAFRRGFTNREILVVLEESHDIKLSLRTLERKLQKNQLWRRRNKTDEAEVASFIHQQLQTSGKQHGYRWMHQKCWMAGIITDRETVRVFLFHLLVWLSLAWKPLFHRHNASILFLFFSLSSEHFFSEMDVSAPLGPCCCLLHQKVFFWPISVSGAQKALISECCCGCCPSACKILALQGDHHMMANMSSILHLSSAVWCLHQSKHGKIV